MLCEPVIFHRITLGDGRKRALPISKHMLHRLEDPNDNLVYSVRHITIDYSSEGAILPEEALSLAICNIRTLESLTWRTWLPVTATILKCLRTIHPYARLNVVAHKRNNLPLDETLLLSPQLHTLDIVLSTLYDKPLRKAMDRSELNHLKTLLVQSNSLKVLRVQFVKIRVGSKAGRSQFREQDLYGDDPLSLQFWNEMLPALDELVLRDFFHWQDSPADLRNDCEALVNHHDWSRLRKLDLRLHGGKELLRRLTAKVPLLQTLKIRTKLDDSHAATLRIFLRSVQQLTHMHLECDGVMTYETFESLCFPLSPHLMTFYVKADCSFRRWNMGSLFELLTRCPQLQTVAMDGIRQQIFGSWTPAEAELSPIEKLDFLVRTAKHHSGSRTIAMYSFQYKCVWRYCPRYHEHYPRDIEKRIGWMGYNDGEEVKVTQEY